MKPSNFERRYSWPLIKITMAVFRLRSFQPDTLKLLRNWDIGKSSVKTRCLRVMNNINIVKSYWRNRLVHHRTNTFKNSVCSISLKFVTYQRLLRIHLWNFPWRKKFKGGKCKLKLGKQTVKHLKILFITKDFNSMSETITTELEYSLSTQASEEQLWNLKTASWWKIFENTWTTPP